MLIVLVELPRRHGGPAPVPTEPTPTRAPVQVQAATSEHAVFLDGQSFVTRGHSLISVRSANGVNPEVGIDPGAARYVLAADPAQHVVWVVGGTAAQAFDARSLAARTQRIRLEHAVTDAVVLDGALYVGNRQSVARLSLRPRQPSIIGTDAQYLAADPTRHRVLALSGSRLSVLGSTYEVTLPGTGGAVAVVSGTVWVALPNRLLQLDPRTLRPLRSVGFGAPIVLAATGRHSLLVGQGAAMSCVSVTVGAIVDEWSSVARPVGIDEQGTIYSLPAHGVPAAVAYGACPN